MFAALGFEGTGTTSGTLTGIGAGAPAGVAAAVVEVACAGLLGAIGLATAVTVGGTTTGVTTGSGGGAADLVRSSPLSDKMLDATDDASPSCPWRTVTSDGTSSPRSYLVAGFDGPEDDTRGRPLMDDAAGGIVVVVAPPRVVGVIASLRACCWGLDAKDPMVTIGTEALGGECGECGALSTFPLCSRVCVGPSDDGTG